jgi:opacity protein-like surface antigen
MKRIVIFLVTAMVFALPASVLAADGSEPATASSKQPLGVYVGGHLGLSVAHLTGMGMGGPAGSDSDGSWGAISAGHGSKNDSLFGGGASFGYDFSPRLNVPIRVEVDYTARNRADVSGPANFSSWYTPTSAGQPQDFDAVGKLTTKLQLQTLMANAWVDIPTGMDLTPYFGGGIGIGFIRHKASYSGVANPGGTIDDSYGRDHETNFAWSVGGGVAYDITQNWTVDLGYKYIDAGKSTVRLHEDGEALPVKAKADAQVHDVMLGLRFTF